MATRQPREQNVHDQEIASLKSANDDKFYVVTNPNQQKNQSVDGYYPDLLLYSKVDRKTLNNIIEVETDSTVTEEHAREQWVPYSQIARRHSAGFYLVVPAQKVNDAQNICKKLNISPEIWQY